MAGNHTRGSQGLLTVENALEKLGQSTQTERAKGLEDFKLLFSIEKRNEHKVTNLRDKDYHRICEALFKILVEEKRHYLKGSTATLRTRALSKLTSAASVLRLVVEVGSPKLKKKTARAVIDHVIDTLPDEGGDFCSSISKDYLKTLRAVLAYKRCIEKFSENDWRLLLEFCIDGIDRHYKDAQEPGLERNGPLKRSISISQMKSSSSHSLSHSTTSKDVDELLGCLVALLSTPNAPLLKYAGNISSSVMQVVRFVHQSLSPSHQAALSILQLTLSSVVADRTEMCKELAKEVVQVIACLWPKAKTDSPKDEMLSILLTVHLHLESALAANGSESLETDIRDLSEVLMSEYSNRDDRRLDQLKLQLEDVEMAALERNVTTTAPLSFLRLRPHNLQAEQNWMLLTVIGILYRLGHMKEHTVPFAASVEEDVDNSMNARKRRRVATHIENLVDALNSVDNKRRLTTIQMLPFVLQTTQLQGEDLKLLLECLATLMVDRSSNVVSWAFLGIASCVTQNAVQSNHLIFDWTHIWHFGARMITSPTHCRAACHLLHVLLAKGLVKYYDIAEDVAAIITSPELSGPAILADSSLSLMTHLLHTRSMEMPGASSVSSQNVIRWVFTRWNPVESAERNVSINTVKIAQPLDFINLLRACLNMPRLKIPTSKTTPCTLIGQAWHRIAAREVMLRYLLLLGDRQPASDLCLSCPAALEMRELENCIETNSHTQLSRGTILELCLPKFRILAGYWDASAADLPKQVFVGTVSATIFTFLLGIHIISLLENIDPRTLSELKQHIESLARTVISFTHGQGKESQKHDEMLLQAIRPYLPSCQLLGSGFRPLAKDPLLLEFVLLYAAEIEDRSSAAGNLNDYQNDSDGDTEMMENGFDSGQHKSKFDVLNDLPREELSLATSAKAFKSSTSTHVILIKAIASSQTTHNFVPTAFIDYLLSLPDPDTLLCWNLLQEILQSNLVLDDSDGMRLFEHYGDLLSKDDYCRSETLQGVCLELLSKTAMIWTSEERKAEDLADIGSEMHMWFIKAALETHILSTAVLIGVAKLLLQLMLLRLLPLERPPALLQILQLGENHVKFYIGAHLSELFELFPLMEHGRRLEEVINHLPANQECNEGIAFRMHAFALLASNWPTVIRICVYYVFECPGRFPKCSDHAARCFSYISAALGLRSARELFRLFASQLLFTWLDGELIDDIPFRTLGYGTLLELVQDTQAEITALMMMRTQDQHVEKLSTLLGIPIKNILQQNFSKVTAYAIAHDIATPPPETGTRTSGEVRIKEILGKTEYLPYVSTHFAEIIALLFCIADQDGGLEKLFSDGDGLIAAGNAMKEMKQISSSEAKLPPNQQPTFRVKYLGREIHHICSRTQLDSSLIYTPTLVSFIARKLYDLISPALGSLHTCAVLRKIRILICMAGPNALHGYPLEMLLQSFRPYLTDPECLEDAIGVVQYLFVHGSAYLSQSPSFVSGIALSTLASLGVFLNSSQASTTQTSQHKAIISKAENFHRWLGCYMKDYNAPLLPENSRKLFQDIVLAAQNIRKAGNAEVDTQESKLLTCLLEDESCSTSLLSRPSREFAFSLLCTEFQQPSSYRDDIFGTDEAATRYAATIWNLCRNRSVSGNFLAWGAKVVGRAFVSNGHIHEELLRESEITRIKELSDQVESKSSSSILRLLQALTIGNDHQAIGLAESTLRFVISTSELMDNSQQLYECQQCLSESLCKASSWGDFEIPPQDKLDCSTDSEADPFSADAIKCKTWLEDLSVKLCRSVTTDPIVSSLPELLKKVKGFAEQAFPFILHSVLSTHLYEKPTVKKDLSGALRHWLNSEDIDSRRNVKLLLNAILYLRTQPLPKETCHADRSKWLDLDYSDAARAAIRCNMFKTALLFTEVSSGTTVKTSRRSSAAKIPIPTDLLLSIFGSIDDPDSFYGVQQGSSLSSVLSRLEYEKDGFKTLSFRSAQYDSNLRRKDPAVTSDADSLVSALGVLRLDGLSHSLVSARQAVGMSSESRESMFRTARKLEQWDIPVSEASLGDAGTIYRTFQVLNNAADHKRIMTIIDHGLRKSMKTLVGENLDASTLHASLQSLSILTEMNEVLTSAGSGNFEEMLQKFEDRAGWMRTGRFEDIGHILSCRETLLSSLSHQHALRVMLDIGVADARLVEVRTSLLSSEISRAHGALQESLASTTYLTGLIQPCRDMGIQIDAAVNLEATNSLWELGEMKSSIGLLQEMNQNSDLRSQTVAVAKSDLLAKLGSRVSAARLEMPDKIISNYLKPALAALKENNTNKESGQVYHEFAAFCDQQLQDPDGLEDFERRRKLRDQKQSDVEELTRIVKTTAGEPKKKMVLKELETARKWCKRDNDEYGLLSHTRDEFLRQGLESYLLALTASDDYDNNNTLRFSAMWLEHSDVEFANKAIEGHLFKVPTRKFIPLINQLTSRLLDRDEPFQRLLSRLVLNVCKDHPYHGMYQIWAGHRGAGDNKDEIAVARQAAAKMVAGQLRTSPQSATIWNAIDRSSQHYCTLAGDNGSNARGEKLKAGPLKDLPSGKAFIATIKKVGIPPNTMHIEIAANRDYSHLPITQEVEPKMSIAGGNSAPKIITLIASDGQKYRQLVKGGIDDLRQDAIMEQVFAQVSEVLHANRSTRQRNLRIRTYKIIPLTFRAGIIEFVPNSVPLQTWLAPAHPRYHPKDMKHEDCRAATTKVAGRSDSEKLKVFRDITDKFHPVLRYFFIEKFDDPDEWFAKRLAYTRSTAANSILGHILGLGDRHGQNILLDEKTGEAVHIDFGFAFESGKVLPVPETVPFRLTRDIVDGMGITGTEGVFRRCCEFTLAALRKESYSIITVLDVLRYDPLYSWTVSLARKARLQKEQNAAASNISEYTTDASAPARGKSKMTGHEPSEANRALEVVRTKLSKTSSVQATVNNVINEATNEANLSRLYQGWAAWC